MYYTIPQITAHCRGRRNTLDSQLLRSEIVLFGTFSFIENPRIRKEHGDFPLFFGAIFQEKICLPSGWPAVYPLIDPLQPGNALDEALHAGCAGLLHLLRNVAVDIQSKSRRVVAQILLYCLDVVPALESGDRIAVPLWHNKDKSENP